LRLMFGSVGPLTQIVRSQMSAYKPGELTGF
jgi:hypothetical protein